MRELTSLPLIAVKNEFYDGLMQLLSVKSFHLENIV